MRVLFASTRGAGHFAPLVPVAQALLRHGHEVRVAAPPALAEDVPRAGLDLWQVDAPPEDELDEVWSRVPSLSQEEQNEVVIGEIFAGLNVRAALPRMREACDEWKPDLIVREPNEYASAVAAEERAIRHARVAIGLAASEELSLRLAGPALQDQLDPEELRRSTYLTPFPASFEGPESAEQPETVRFRLPESEAPALADWWPGDERPLVYVTFGSVAGGFQQTLSLYRGAAHAVAGLPVRVLVTVGREADVDALAADAPANVTFEAWVPQEQVLPHAAVVVCHAGSGSTLGALAAGLPIVAVPLFADQPQNAERIVATGAGVRVPPDGEAIRSAVERVLGGEGFRRRARELGAEMRGHAALDDVLPG